MQENVSADNNIEKNYEDLLLIVRGIASLCVVIWHAGGYLGTYPPILNVPGRTAVWIFFGISGYVIAYGFIHRRYTLKLSDLKDFYINRFLRIYPIFILITLVTLVTELAVSGVSPIKIYEVPAELGALQFNQDYKVSGVFWTLGIEMHFYLLAPLLVLPFLMKRAFWYKWVPLAMYLAAVFWIYYAVKNLGWSWDSRNIVGNIPHFLAGMIACKVVQNWKPSALRFWLSIFGACILIGLTNWLYHMAPVIIGLWGFYLLILSLCYLYSLTRTGGVVPVELPLTQHY